MCVFMNNEEMSDMIKNFANMMDSNNIPDNLKDILHNMNSSSSDSNSNDSEHTSSNNSINPELLSQFANMFGNSSQKESSNKDSSSDSSSNIDIDMLLKMKTIIEQMNRKQDDPRTNLLLSLKPYLKESRKAKVDQYAKLFSMGKVMEILNPNGGEKNP